METLSLKQAMEESTIRSALAKLLGLLPPAAHEETLLQLALKYKVIKSTERWNKDGQDTSGSDDRGTSS